MKIRYMAASIALAALSLASCNDSSMDRFPKESQSEETAFQTSSNFRTYAWSLYSIFTNSNITLSYQATGPNQSNWSGDLLANYVRNGQNSGIANAYADRRVNPDNTSGWSFSFIRQVNIMLDHIDASKMNDDEKAHWRAVGYFFRAYNYVELIMRYGDVPWIDHALTEDEAMNDIPQRRPRTEVAAQVLDDLLYARDNINAKFALNADGDNTINRNVVNALISRFGLWEATWCKYHNVEGGDIQRFLNASIEASEALMKAYPSIDANFDAKYNTENGSDVKGMILYKEFVTDEIMHNTNQYLRSDASRMELTKQGMNMYLMQNGKPVHNAANADAFSDETMYKEFRDRDYRLYYSVMPPFVAKRTGNTTWDYADDAIVKKVGMKLTTDEARYYIDLMEQLSPATGKRLPVTNWAGNVMNIVPHFFNKTNGSVNAIAPMKCYSGYFCWLEYNTWEHTISGAKNVGTADKPIFMMEEVLLNYAEAKYEKGEFTQAVADQTINKLRARVNVAAMNVSEIDAAFDPDRDPSVDPVAWEIRRERFTELLGQGFGFYDIRRWKTAPWWINQQPLGVYMRRADEGGLPAATMKLSNGDEGYILLEPTRPDEISGKGWDDTFYLYPIPRGQFSKNPGLTQNPGWDKY